MIPKKEENIYPRNKENIRAIIDFYFSIPDGDLKYLFEQKKLSTNQIEFIANKVSKYSYFFEMKLDKTGMTVANLMNYGISALSELETNWEGDNHRKEIIKEFKELVLKNDDELNHLSN